MKITDLNVPVSFKLVESRRYLYEGLDRSATQSAMLWESAGNRLVEYALTPDQINKIFQDAEAGMAGQGANRTMLGKGVDVAKTGVEAAKEVNKAWEDLKTKISNSGPVKGFDQKVSDVLSKIGVGAKDPQFQGLVSNWVQKYRDFATQHPIIQGAVYATLIAVAGLSGAGVAGAAGLGLLKMADKLLQGERFSSAAYSGAKTGALAYGAGQAKQAYSAHQAAANAANGQGLPAHPSAASDYNGTATGPDGSNVTNPIGPDNVTAPVGAGGDLGGGNYTIMKGDTMGSIAQAQGIPDADLQGLNPQIDFSKPLQPGMNINLPGAGDNAGSVWQGYQGGNYGDAASAAHKAAGHAANAATQQADTATQAAGTATNAATQQADTATQAAGGIHNQADLDNYVQKSIDAGTTPTGPDLSGFTEVTPQGGDVTTQLKNLVAKGYHVAQSQQYPDHIEITDASGKVVQQFNPGNRFLANRLSAAANGINLRESFIDTRQTARKWMLRESLGRPRGGVVLTEMAIANILYEAGEAVDTGAAPAAEPKKPGALKRISNWFKQKGSNLTNKVTADKLKQTWIKQQMPDDSEEIAKILSDAGVGKAIISNIFKGMGVPTAGAAQAQAGGQQPQAQGQAQNQGQAQPQAQGQPGGNTGTRGQAQPQAQAAGAEEPQQQGLGSKIKQAAGNFVSDTGKGLGMIGDVARGAAGAVERGKYGLAGASDTSYLQKSQTDKARGPGTVNPNVHTMYDKAGKPYTYTKKGGKWVDAQGGEVPPAFAASIEAQIAQKQKDALNKQKAGPGVDANAMAAKQAAGAKAAAGSMKASDGTATKTQATQGGVTAANRINNTTPGQYTAHGAGTTGPQTYNKGIQAFPNNDTTKAAQPMATANNANATAEPKEPTLNPEPQAQAKPAATSFAGNQTAGYGKATYNVPTGAAVPTAKAPAATPTKTAATPTASAQADAGKPGFLQSKIKGRQPAVTAEGRNFAGILWKQMKGL